MSKHDNAMPGAWLSVVEVSTWFYIFWLEIGLIAYKIINKGMSWNFRYPLMKRRDQTTTIVYDMKMSISNWLDLLGLQQYESE